MGREPLKLRIKRVDGDLVKASLVRTSPYNALWNASCAKLGRVVPPEMTGVANVRGVWVTLWKELGSHTYLVALPVVKCKHANRTFLKARFLFFKQDLKLFRTVVYICVTNKQMAHTADMKLAHFKTWPGNVFIHTRNIYHQGTLLWDSCRQLLVHFGQIKVSLEIEVKNAERFSVYLYWNYR